MDRNFGARFTARDMKKRRDNRVLSFLEGKDDLSLTGKVSIEIIDFFTTKIHEIERYVEDKVALKDEYRHLLGIPGIGKVLGLTIMLETGDVTRFAKVGNYVSYCRKVSTSWTSNDKKKGKGNKKNGNKYLAWAFSEAAEFARRRDEKAKSFYNRKMQKKNFMVAHNALAHKLARAAYYIMKDQAPYMPEKLFS